MIRRIYTQCKDCIYEKITDRTIYYMKKYHGFDIIKTYFRPADFYIGECEMINDGVIWCDKPGRNDIIQNNNRKIIVTSVWLKKYLEKKGIKVEQVTPFGIDEEIARKYVNFDFNVRRGYTTIIKTMPDDMLKVFEGRRKQLTLISDHFDADFQFTDLNENLKYYLLSRSLFYIKINSKEGFDIYPIEAMSVGTPLIYIKNHINSEYSCGIEIDSLDDLKKIEIRKDEWENLSWECWSKSLKYYYVTIGQELWKWFNQ